MSLNNKVMLHRERCGLNQTELAQICEVSRQTISSIERGNYHPSVLLALRMAECFGVSVEEIFDYEEE